MPQDMSISDAPPSLTLEDAAANIRAAGEAIEKNEGAWHKLFIDECTALLAGREACHNHGTGDDTAFGDWLLKIGCARYAGKKNRNNRAACLEIARLHREHPDKVMAMLRGTTSRSPRILQMKCEIELGLREKPERKSGNKPAGSNPDHTLTETATLASALDDENANIRAAIRSEALARFRAKAVATNEGKPLEPLTHKDALETIELILDLAAHLAPIDGVEMSDALGPPDDELHEQFIDAVIVIEDRINDMAMSI
jgi:hypothetical protein